MFMLQLLLYTQHIFWENTFCFDCVVCVHLLCTCRGSRGIWRNCKCVQIYYFYINNIINILFTICLFHIARNTPYTLFAPDLFHSHYFQFQKCENIFMYSVYLGPVYMEVKDPW